MATKILILSDTHATEYAPPAQHADVALHCGDLTEESKIDEFRATIQLLKGINAPLKLVIAGNHDFTLDIPMFKQKVAEMPGPADPELVKKVFGDYGEARKLFEEARKDGIILLDEGVYTFDLANGASLMIYASPFTPSEGDWGFQYRLKEGHNFKIEDGVDIVMTHGPPHGLMDRPYSSPRVGCPDLFKAVFQARPRLHCFGHIHEEWGAKLVTWRDNADANPSHLSVIENDPGKSPQITNLSRLAGSKYDEPETRAAKLEKLKTSEREGCYSTSHCAIPAFFERSSAIPLSFLTSETCRSPPPIAAPLREALFECFRATTRLVQPELRRQLILVGGAASIAHSSVLYTEDVDIAAPSSVIIGVWERVQAGAPGFSIEPDGKIAFDTCQDIRVRIDLIELGEGCIEQIHVAEPFFEGSVASMSDLLRLRAVTVVDRGSDGEMEDFRWLLSEVAEAGQLLPELEEEEVGSIIGAGEATLGLLDRLVLLAVLDAKSAPLLVPLVD
ncbi:hypothetical protein FQN49_005709, partial [Arthroderma sp. PD_2]